MSLTTALTYALPHRLLSSMARSLAYSDDPRVSRWLIDTVTRKFNVNLDEAANPDPRSYATFNQFFTRALKPGARAADADPRSLVMPADGRISQLGKIEAGRIFQAKGQSFTAAELLGSDEDAKPYNDGLYATVYLSPRDYHRVHMPWTGTLRETVHVPGRLFSVGPAAVNGVPRLFARNERLVTDVVAPRPQACSAYTSPAWSARWWTRPHRPPAPRRPRPRSRCSWSRPGA